MDIESRPIRGRGAAANPKNRFADFEYITVPYQTDFFADEESRLRTQFLRDHSRSVISYNDSPDINFKASINPYRGCEHGCIYCFARPTHEYLDFSSGLDFETKILVKEDSPQLLRKEFSSKRWQPQTVAFSSVTDPYQPVERRLQLTRRCLEVFTEFRNPVTVLTKNHLVTRDIDIFIELAKFNAINVLISISTFDNKLRRILEPRTSTTARRLKTIRILSEANIPVIVLNAPIIPALNDHETPKIIEEAAKAGAICAGFAIVRLPYSVKTLFVQWLENHFPDRKEKVLNRIRAMRGGRLNDPNFRSRMQPEGIFADQIKALFHTACKKAGIEGHKSKLSTAAFRRPQEKQLSLFD